MKSGKATAHLGFWVLGLGSFEVLGVPKGPNTLQRENLLERALGSSIGFEEYSLSKAYGTFIRM